MAQKRSNPFAADGKMTKAAWKDKTTNESVKVMAHTRLKPQRRVVGNDTSDPVSDNAFARAAAQFNEPQGPQDVVGGLSGEAPVNHLKAAVGLLNRKGAKRV